MPHKALSSLSTASPEGVSLQDGVVEAVETKGQEVQIEYFHGSSIQRSHVLVLERPERRPTVEYNQQIKVHSRTTFSLV